MLNFQEHMLPVPKTAVFRQEGYCVWCGTMAKHGEKYYLFFSHWPISAKHEGWVTQSEVGVAIGDSPTGPFAFDRVVLRGSGKGKWDGDCIHNPTVISYDGKYYMYYMGNYGNGEYWDHRNHQRIGCAVADHPLGPWTHSHEPVIDVTPGSFDSLMTSNPTVCVTPDHGILAVYKGVCHSANMPKGGAVICGVARADHPLGPFVKEPTPIMVNPEEEWSVEDPYIWYMDGRYYALVKDFQGYFTRAEKSSVALFESLDGRNWGPSEHPLAFHLEIQWEDGSVEPMLRLERPQLLLENGRPVVLMCAASNDPAFLDTCNIQIPVKF